MSFRIVSVATVAVVLGLSLLQAVEEQTEVRWGTDPTRAMSESRAAGKPVLVDVWAVWCVPCREMDRTTYRDPAVIGAMDGFVTLKIDHDAQETFVERHAVEALPAVLFLDSAGREITRLSGLVKSAPLMEAMNNVSLGYAAYLENVKRPKDSAAIEATAAYLLASGNPPGAADLLRRALKGLKEADPASREKLEVALAEAQLAAGDLRPATAAFERLASGAVDPAARSRALAGLVRAQRERGQTAEADAALSRLQMEFPEAAAELVAK